MSGGPAPAHRGVYGRKKPSCAGAPTRLPIVIAAPRCRMSHLLYDNTAARPRVIHLPDVNTAPRCRMGHLPNDNTFLRCRYYNYYSDNSPPRQRMVSLS